jgi:hypothetical protein
LGFKGGMVPGMDAVNIMSAEPGLGATALILSLPTIRWAVLSKATL